MLDDQPAHPRVPELPDVAADRGWAIAGQPTDRWIGVIVVLTGVFDFAIMPRILARRWRTPPAP